MNYPLPVFEEWVPCAPMFAPDGDGFVLTDAAHALLDSPEPLHPAPLSVLERIAAVRVELACLAAALPAAARVMAPPDLLDALEALQEAANALGSLDQTVVAEVDRSEAFVRWGFTSTASLSSYLCKWLR